MNKKFMAKILSGEKTIESRWSMQRRVPFGAVKKGDTVFFKPVGGMVSARARVTGVRYFERQDGSRAIYHFVMENHQNLGLESRRTAREFLDDHSKKRFVTFIQLGKIHPIQSFSIDKTGHGVRASWLVVEDIRDLMPRSRINV